MKRKVLRFAMASLVAMAGAFVVSSPAAASLNDCPGGTGCVWAQANYSGAEATYSVGNSGLDKCHLSSLRVGVAESIEAIYGSPVTRLTLFTGINCDGSSMSIKNGDRLTGFSFPNGSYEIQTT